jgi:hypothetical protein
MDIVIDFDGTCVTHEFPAIGKEIGATPVLRELVDAGHRLILFTIRSNDKRKNNHTLDEAVKWFHEREIPLYGIQIHPEQCLWTLSPKAYGDLYIDDAAIGCPLIISESDERPYVDWKTVRKLLEEKGLL